MKLREFGVLFLLGAIWGASYLFIKVGVAVFPPATLVSARVIIAGLLSLAVLRGRGLPLSTKPADWGNFAVMGLLNGALPYSLITWGEQHITSGLAAILIAAAPIFTVICAQFVLRDEKLNLVKAAGIMLGFLGVVVLVGPDALGGARDNLWGDLAVVLASASYGAAFIWTRLKMRGYPPMAATTGQLIMASIYMTPIALLLEHPWTLQLAWTNQTVAAVASLLALAILGTSLAYIMYYWLVEHLGATQASLVTYISPFISLVWGALFLGERLTLAAILGFGLILLGLALINGFASQVVSRLAPSGAGR